MRYNSYPNADAYSDTDTDTYSNADTYANANPDPDPDANRLEETSVSWLHACELRQRFGLHPDG